MANQEHLDILKRGVEIWNQWREEHSDIQPNLSGANLFQADLLLADLSGANLSGAWLSRATLNGADLRGANLSAAGLSDADLLNAFISRADLSDADLTGADLSGSDLRGANLSEATLKGADLSGDILSRANLSGADLTGARLFGADLTDADLREATLFQANLSSAHLTGADLREATLFQANLSDADLSKTDLRETILREANLREANLSHANLREANLSRATLVETNLEDAILTGCHVYGIAVWNVKLEGVTQDSLIITSEYEATITVDNLEVAQFIYLLLNNPKIREVIDTIAKKAVLILGRFTPERKAVLDAIREKLRSLNFLPIVFDFERPTAHDFTETIMTLAGLSCFIIADITNPKSSPLELQATVLNYMTPFVPIIQEGEQPFSMFTDLQNRYRDWVLDTLLYDTPSNLINVLERAVVQPALELRTELLFIKAQGLRTRHIKDYS